MHLSKTIVVINLLVALIFSSTSFASASDWVEDDSVQANKPVQSKTLELDDSLEDDQFIQSISKLTENERIILLELNLLGHANPEGSHKNRLAELEEEVADIPLREKEPTTQQQIATIIQVAPPSDALVRYLVENVFATQFNPWSSKRVPFVGSVYQQMNWMERAVFGKPHRNERIKRRVLKLELAVLDKSRENRDELSITERVRNLYATINPPETLLALDFPATPLLIQPASSQVKWKKASGGGISKGVRKFFTGTSSARATLGNILSSPAFWNVVAGGAALFGAYMLSRNSGEGSQINYIESERMCQGNWDCRRCKNCFYCKHCNTTLQPCGVLIRTRGLR